LKVKIGGIIEKHFREMPALCLAADADMGSLKRGALKCDGSWAAAGRKDLAGIKNSIEQTGKFNTGEIEKAKASHWEMGDLEAYINSTLRQAKGGLCTGENAGSVARCVFRDNALKPKTVTDLRLSFNIPETGLISPAFQYRAAVEYCVREIIGKSIVKNIDREIAGIAGDDFYSQKEFAERIAEIQLDAAAGTAGNAVPLGEKDAALNELRNRGFALTLSSLVSALNDNGMDYQYIENRKNRREACIREYEDTETAALPDERFQITMRYLDGEQLAAERGAYDAQIKSFVTEVQHLWDLMEVIYQDSKSVFKVNDFDDLSRKNKSRIKYLIKDKTGEPLYENIIKAWDEITFIRPAETDLQKANPDYNFEKNWIRGRFAVIRERIQNTVEFMNAVEQNIAEERLLHLEKEYNRFDSIINPFQIEAGLVIDMEITTIKRKETTLDSAAAMLNQLALRAPVDFDEAGALIFDAPTLPAKASPRKS
jgi:hypothetical protein